MSYRAKWRERSEETRAVANEMIDATGRLIMLMTADDYERLVKRAEQIERGLRAFGK
jgi:hypothetical protein